MRDSYWSVALASAVLIGLSDFAWSETDLLKRVIDAPQNTDDGDGSTGTGTGDQLRIFRVPDSLDGQSRTSPVSGDGSTGPDDGFPVEVPYSPDSQSRSKASPSSVPESKGLGASTGPDDGAPVD